MESEKKNELNVAYHTLCEYNLWRRGKTDSGSFSEKEIGDAIDTAAGAILDYIACSARLDIAESSLRGCENALKHEKYELSQQEAITVSTMQMLDSARKENRRMKAILAAKHISYKKR